MELRENLLLPAHMYRVVRIFEDDDARIIIAYTDANETSGKAEMHIIDSWNGTERSHGEVESAVKDLNDHIAACRRVIGLDTDVLARNGID